MATKSFVKRANEEVNNNTAATGNNRAPADAFINLVIEFPGKDGQLQQRQIAGLPIYANNGVMQNVIVESVQKGGEAAIAELIPMIKVSSITLGKHLRPEDIEQVTIAGMDFGV